MLTALMLPRLPCAELTALHFWILHEIYAYLRARKHPTEGICCGVFSSRNPARLSTKGRFLSACFLSMRSAMGDGLTGTELSPAFPGTFGKT